LPASCTEKACRVFHPCIADGHLRHAGKLRQLARHKIGVRTALLHPQQRMFASTVGVITKHFLDLEILRTDAHARGQRRVAESMGKFGHGDTLER
jgi:hypothetical protein